MVLFIAAGAVAALGLTLAGASAVGSRRFRDRYEREKAELLQRGRAAAPVRSASPAAELPPVVQRYLEVSGAAERPPLKVAILKQRGTLRTAADKPWIPFESEQVYAFEPPGFVWWAQAQVAPLVPMLARDKFVDGEGHMLIRLLGAFTVADGRGPEMDQGAGLRFWGEVVAFPETVRSPYVRWSPEGEHRARMTIEQGRLKMSAVIEFNGEGLPIGMHAERYRDVGGKSVLTPWSGHMRDWKRVEGRLFPASWESVWHLPEGDFPAVRMEILGIQTE